MTATKQGLTAAKSIDVQNVDLRNVQERTSDMMKSLTRNGRRAFWAYAGLWAMAYDQARDLVKQGEETWVKAVDRGEVLESRANKEITRLRKDLRRRVRRAGKSIRKAESQLEDRVSHLVEESGLPGREQVKNLVRRAEDVVEVAEEAMDRGAAELAQVAHLPIAGYPSMTVKEVRPLLQELDPEQLRAVLDYERSHENRVTILRFIEGVLGQESSDPAPPSA